MKRNLLAGAKNLRALIIAALLFPIFFQMSTGLYSNPARYYESGGILRNLPLPASIMACFIGLAIFWRYRFTRMALTLIASTAVLMAISAVILTPPDRASEIAKFLMLGQFLLPMFGLMLGQTFEASEKNVDDAYCAKPFFWVLVLVVPLELLSTLDEGSGVLSPNVLFFAVYQHLQYVPVIFVSAYLLSMFGLWHQAKYRTALSCLTLCVGVYVTAAMSMLAICLFFAGLLSFALMWMMREGKKFPLLLLVTTIAVGGGYFHFKKDLIGFKYHFVTENGDVSATGPRTKKHTSLHSMLAMITGRNEKSETANVNQMLPNVMEREAYWKYYSGRIMSDAKSFFVGVGVPPIRAKYPSAHNYYLDFIYNFGAVALLPLLLLVAYTLVLLRRHRSAILGDSNFATLSAVTLFLFIAENVLTVGLKEPYPGIFTFFLWGILLTKLAKLAPSAMTNVDIW